MKYSEFIGEAQDRLQYPTQAKAVRSVRAVLTVLGQRIHSGEASDLAGALPLEIDRFLEEAESGQRFSRSEFISRVAEIEDSEEADAFRHIQLVFQLVAEVVPAGEVQDIYADLPDEFEDFFAEVDLDLE